MPCALWQADAHSRLNACCFTLRFTGIAVGSTLGSLAWAYGGWPTVIAVGAPATPSLSALGETSRFVGLA